MSLHSNHQSPSTIPIWPSSACISLQNSCVFKISFTFRLTNGACGTKFDAAEKRCRRLQKKSVFISTFRREYERGKSQHFFVITGKRFKITCLKIDRDQSESSDGTQSASLSSSPLMSSASSLMNESSSSSSSPPSFFFRFFFLPSFAAAFHEQSHVSNLPLSLSMLGAHVGFVHWVLPLGWWLAGRQYPG